MNTAKKNPSSPPNSNHSAPQEGPKKTKSGTYQAIRPPMSESVAPAVEESLMKIANAVLDETARKLLRQAATHPAKPEVETVYSLGATPGARGTASTRVRFESGREVLLAGRMGKKEARRRATAIVEAEFTARLVAACSAAANWLEPLASGGGAQRPVVEAWRLLRAALESGPQKGAGV